MMADRNLEEALRRALTAQAETVPTSPNALGVIRGRIERRRARWWLPRSGTAGLALAGAATALVLVAGVAGGATWWREHRAGPGPAASPAATVTGDTSTAKTFNLPVYYLGPARLGDRLYREYHVLPPERETVVGAVGAVVQAMLDRPADDPDYRSPWPAGATVRKVAVDGDIVTVDLAGAAGDGAFDAAVDDLTARMAVQQLVWTVTASAGGPTGVRLLLDGTPATSLWGRADVSGVLRRGPAADVLAQIWIIDPQQGTEQGRRFTVRLAGIVFEATVRVRLRDAAGTVIDDFAVHLAGGAPAQGTGTVQVGLPPGRYTIEGYVVSERDGSEQVYDEHQFTVG